MWLSANSGVDTVQPMKSAGVYIEPEMKWTDQFQLWHVAPRRPRLNGPEKGLASSRLHTSTLGGSRNQEDNGNSVRRPGKQAGQWADNGIHSGWVWAGRQAGLG